MNLNKYLIGGHNLKEIHNQNNKIVKFFKALDIFEQSHRILLISRYCDTQSLKLFIIIFKSYRKAIRLIISINLFIILT